MSSIINASTSGGLISTADTSGILKLQTAGTDAVTIDASQRVGVGTTSPNSSYRMTVDGGASLAGIRVQGTNPRVGVWGDGSTSIGVGPNYYLQSTSGGSTWAAAMQMGPSAEILFFQYPNGSWNERMRIDSSGNLGVGTSSPNSFGKLAVVGITGLVNSDIDGTYSTCASFQNATYNTRYQNLIKSSVSSDISGSGLSFWLSSGSYTTAEVMRLQGGNLLLGDTTNTGTSKQLVVADTNSYNIFTIKDTNATTYNTSKWYQQFLNSTNGVAGSIQHSSITGVTYATSSDIRLKENVETAPAALEKVLGITVRSFDWKVDEAHVDYGFIAQELYQVVPEAVGKGDDTEELTDPKGTWQVEYGRLTPILVKAIQEQQALINAQQTVLTSLTERITALEGAAQ